MKSNALKQFLALELAFWPENLVAVLVLGAAIYYNGAIGILYGIFAVLYWTATPLLFVGVLCLVRSGVRAYRRRAQHRCGA